MEEEEGLYLRLETPSICKLTRRSPNAVARHRSDLNNKSQVETGNHDCACSRRVAAHTSPPLATAMFYGEEPSVLRGTLHTLAAQAGIPEPRALVLVTASGRFLVKDPLLLTSSLNKTPHPTS